MDQILLLRDVDGNTDQMKAGFAGLTDQFASCAKPYPVAGRMAHPESVIDRCCRCVRKFSRKLVKANVVRMHQSIDIAE
ncbi:MAG TPA: hypothetical protein VGD41_19280 [Pyrinomonadaceae bacterium]